MKEKNDRKSIFPIFRSRSFSLSFFWPLFLNLILGLIDDRFVVEPLTRKILGSLNVSIPIFKSLSEASYINTSLFHKLAFPIVEVAIKISNVLLKIVTELPIPMLETIFKLSFVILRLINVKSIFSIPPSLNHAYINTSSHIFFLHFENLQTRSCFEFDLFPITMHDGAFSEN